MVEIGFSTDARIKNVLGKDLIKDDITAINELVKNAIDAEATKVDIIINEDEIRISDNGIGMSKDDLINKWFRLAYSSKSHKSGVAGSKGIGRFSCDRLGHKVDIYTRKKSDNTNAFNYVSINWDQYDVTGPKDFSSIKFPLMEKIKEDEEYNTSIIIKDLKFNYNEKLISNRGTKRYYEDNKEKLLKTLQKLIMPKVFDDESKNVAKITLNGEVIENKVFKYLEKSGTYIYSIISDDVITVALYFRGNEIFTYSKKNTYKKLYNLETQIHYLTHGEKSQFAKQTGANVQSYGSIFFFNNGFRVFPYGEPGDDYLTIDARKTQGYNRFLGSRELLGYLSFTNNTNIIESSSREGISDGNAIDEIRDFFIEDLLKPLEYYLSNLVSWDNVKVGEGNKSREISSKEFDNISEDAYRKFKNYIDRKADGEVEINRPNLSLNVQDEQKKAQSKINQLSPEAKAKLAHEEKKKEELENKLEEISRQYSNTSDLTKKLVNSVFHDISNYIKNVNINIKKVSKEMNKADKINKNKSIQIIKDMQQNAKSISNISKYGVDGIVRSYGHKKECDIISLLKEILEFDKSLSKGTMSFNFNLSGSYKAQTSYLNTVSFLNNILFNAKKARATEITFNLNGNILEIFDNGEGLDSSIENVSDILKIGYSTTGGTGLGLMYIQEFIQRDLKSDLSVENRDGTLIIKVELNNEYIA